MSDDVVLCNRCRGYGEIGVRASNLTTYVGPGPVPDDVQGVVATRCDRCNGTGYLPEGKENDDE